MNLNKGNGQGHTCPFYFAQLYSSSSLLSSIELPSTEAKKDNSMEEASTEEDQDVEKAHLQYRKS